VRLNVCRCWLPVWLPTNFRISTTLADVVRRLGRLPDQPIPVSLECGPVRLGRTTDEVAVKEEGRADYYVSLYSMTFAAGITAVDVDDDTFLTPRLGSVVAEA
jgi:hypothetical protein